MTNAQRGLAGRPALLAKIRRSGYAGKAAIVAAMLGSDDVIVREPIVAGQFYPESSDRCREQLQACLERAAEASNVPRRVVGGIVPHAGWMCSGHVTAGVFRAIQAVAKPETIVLFGAVHRWSGRQAAMFASGRWDTPLGPVQIDTRLAERLLGHTNAIGDDPYAHEDEHSLEVQMPFVRHFFPDAKVLPIMVPPGPAAIGIGQTVASTLEVYRVPAVVLATTDLTHYGPSYQFTPHGSGDQGRRWAKEVNDRRMIELMEQMSADGIVPEAREHQNACGAGAVAAVIASARQQGADQAVVIEHTTSYEVLRGRGSGDSVGYVGLVYGSN